MTMVARFKSPYRFSTIACASLALLGCCKMARDLYRFDNTSFDKKVNKAVEKGAVAVFHCKPVE